jgi:hypothetical protein
MKRFMTLLGLASLFAISNSLTAQTNDDAKTLTDADRLQMQVQKICPISGEDLGSMGKPLKAKMGEQDVYLCCKGCVGKQAGAEHWQKIQDNLAKAQGTCPIMGKPVTSKLKSTVVNGQQVFVCCPPCIEKIKADPEAALKKINASYTTYLEAEKELETRDHAEHKQDKPETK